jgi:hypothetical protein
LKGLLMYDTLAYINFTMKIYRGGHLKPELRSWLSRFIAFLKYALVVLTFYYIYRYLQANWHELKSLNIHVNIWYLIIAFIILNIGWLLSCWNWGKVLEAFDCKVPYRIVYIIYFRSMPAKYLPGKVWHLAGSTYVSRKMGVSEGPSIAAFVITQAYSILSGIVLIMAAIAFGIMQKPGGGILPFRWTAALLLAATVVLVAKPGLIGRLMNLILPLFKLRKITVDVKITTSLFLFSIYIIPWLVYGLAFWLLADAMINVPFRLYPALTAIFATGTVIGFLAVFSPGGIGVRAAAIAAVAPAVVPFSAAFALAVGLIYRLAVTVIEIIYFGVTWLLSRNQDKAECQQERQKRT